MRRTTGRAIAPGVDSTSRASEGTSRGLRRLSWVTVGAVFLWNFGVSRLGVVVASLFLNLVPVSAVLIAAAMGTAPTLTQLVGGLLVLAGVLQAQLRRLRLARRAGRAATALRP